MIKTLIHLLLVLIILWTFIVSVLAIGFGGPIVLGIVLGFYLWLLALAWAVWLLWRPRLNLEVYVLIVLGFLNALILLNSVIGRAFASAANTPVVSVLLLLLFLLPFALWIWIGVRKLKRG